MGNSINCCMSREKKRKNIIYYPEHNGYIYLIDDGFHQSSDKKQSRKCTNFLKIK